MAIVSQERPLVTVITPVYNRAEFIEAAMDSAWKQTYRPIELIIVDDGSTDESPRIVRQWCSGRVGDPLFSTVFMRQANRGACAARNGALKIAKGQYIQWLDDDDIMYPRKLEVQVRYLEGHPDVDAVACQLDYGNHDLRLFGRTATAKPSDSEDMHLFPIKHDVLGYAPVYRKSILDSVGGWREGLPCGQDTDLHARLALAGARFAVIDDRLGIVRCHSRQKATGFHRQRQSASYDRLLYEGIHRFACSCGLDSEAVRRVIAQRLRQSAYNYFGRLMIGRGAECLRGVYILLGRDLSSWDCIGRHTWGMQVMGLSAFAFRSLCAVGRRMNPCFWIRRIRVRYVIPRSLGDRDLPKVEIMV